MQKYCNLIFRQALQYNTPAYYFAAKKNQNNDEQKPKDQNKMDKTSEYLLRQLREKKQRYATTRDNYRIDIGLIIERLPIFLQLEQNELEEFKFRRKYINKYKLKLEIPKDLTEFTEKHPSLEFERHDTENLISHLNPETKEIYHENSKLFKNTDPEIKDPKSIQYASNYSVYLMVKQNGKWQFPYQTMYERQSLQESLTELTDTLTNGVFSTHLQYETPIACMRKDKSELDQKDARNKGLKGLKRFYYTSFHMSGNVPRALEGQYEDFAWVPRRELQNYLDEEEYNRIAQVVTE